MKSNPELRKKRQRGNALLEAGLAAPMMFLMLSGVIDFGRAFYYTDLAVSAARAGAQYGMMSPSNVNNYTGMRVNAMTDANASCQDSKQKSVSCSDTTMAKAYVGPGYEFTATASSECKDSSFSVVACTAANARPYVKVFTTIKYSLLVSWPGLPSALGVGGEAIVRTK